MAAQASGTLLAIQSGRQPRASVACASSGLLASSGITFNLNDKLYSGKDSLVERSRSTEIPPEESPQEIQPAAPTPLALWRGQCCQLAAVQERSADPD